MRYNDDFVDTIALDIKNFKFYHYIDEFVIENNLEFSLQKYANKLVLELKSQIATEDLGKIKIKYPENWKEAFKERWFPQWALQKWPVKYHIETYDIKAYYGKVSIPKYNPTIKVYKNESF